MDVCTADNWGKARVELDYGRASDPTGELHIALDIIEIIWLEREGYKIRGQGETPRLKFSEAKAVTQDSEPALQKH